MVGYVKETDTGKNEQCLRRFIRAQVLIDVTKPLLMGLRVRLREEDEVCSMVICYERLPNFYYFCGKIGHLLRECYNNDWGLLDGPNLKFGAWLRAPVIDRLRGRGGRFEKPGMKTKNKGQKAGPNNMGDASNHMESSAEEDVIL
ncbi:hypothetical protein ACOSQ4_023193 [Xanthoceras sorbifolium]